MHSERFTTIFELKSPGPISDIEYLYSEYSYRCIIMNVSLIMSAITMLVIVQSGVAASSDSNTLQQQNHFLYCNNDWE